MHHQDEYVENDLEYHPGMEHGGDPTKYYTLESLFEEKSTFFMYFKFDGAFSKDLEKRDHINSLEINNGYFLHIEEGM